MNEKELTDEEFDIELERRLKEFEKIKEKASEFAKMCVMFEWEFSYDPYSEPKNTNDNRFVKDIFIKTFNDKIIKISFYENGHVALNIKEENKIAVKIAVP